MVTVDGGERSISRTGRAGADRGGTGSKPPRAKGWQRSSLPDGKRAAAQRAMHGDGHGRILRACGQIFAPARAERVQRRRKPAAIKSDDSEQQARHGADVTGVLSLGCGRLGSARRLGPGLFKDTHNLRLKLHKFHSEHIAARMEDQIEALGQKVDVAAQSLAHAALDAVALVSLAQHFADGEADARRGRSAGARFAGRLRRQKPAHGCGLPFAAIRVGAQIVGMFAQARSRQRLASGGLGIGVHEEGSTRNSRAARHIPLQSRARA